MPNIVNTQKNKYILLSFILATAFIGILGSGIASDLSTNIKGVILENLSTQELLKLKSTNNREVIGKILKIIENRVPKECPVLQLSTIFPPREISSEAYIARLNDTLISIEGRQWRVISVGANYPGSATYKKHCDKLNPQPNITPTGPYCTYTYNWQNNSQSVVTNCTLRARIEPQ